MKKTIALLGALAALLFSGCTTYYRDSGSTFLERPTSVSPAPYYTEYEYGKNIIKAEGTASVLLGVFQFAENKRCMPVVEPHLSIWSVIDNFFSPTYQAVKNAKWVAIYNACEQSDAEEFVGVTCDYVVKNYFFYATVKCIAKGFPAKVKGVKPITQKPVILNKWQRIEYVAPHEDPVAYPDSLYSKPAKENTLLEVLK